MNSNNIYGHFGIGGEVSDAQEPLSYGLSRCTTALRLNVYNIVVDDDSGVS